MKVEVTNVFKYEGFWSPEMFELFPVPYEVGKVFELDVMDPKVGFNLLGEPCSIRQCMRHPEFGLVLFYQISVKVV